MVEGLLCISLLICWIVIIGMQRIQKKLESRIKANEDYIKDLYRIDDERLLKK